MDRKHYLLSSLTLIIEFSGFQSCPTPGWQFSSASQYMRVLGYRVSYLNAEVAVHIASLDCGLIIFTPLIQIYFQ